MTPKEKAEELVDKMYNVDEVDDYTDMYMQHKHAIRCALIAVEEVFLAIGDDYFKKYEFYLEVKRQLEKL